jgi:hypothetical protein
MDKTFLRLLIAIASAVFVYATIVLIASIVQLADAADRIHLGLGQPVFWVLFAVFAGVIISPFYLYFKLPKALVPPAENAGPEFEKYLVQLRKRLSSNRRLNGRSLNNQSEIEEALAQLSGDADKVIKETAAAVFISTAIMQNGKLDGLVTFATQARMVWRIACVYQQRPSPRQMIYLYSNVGVSALLAESIQDIDLTEIISPLISSSFASAIPGASLVVNSITNGAANAFLTLRVGVITREYCRCLSTPERSMIRRIATLAAMTMVGAIVKEHSGRIISGSWNAIKEKSGAAVDSVKNGVNIVAERTADSVVAGTKNIGRAVSSTSETVVDAVNAGAKSVGNAVGSTASMMANTVRTGAKVVSSAVGTSVESTKQIAKGITTKSNKID